MVEKSSYLTSEQLAVELEKCQAQGNRPTVEVCRLFRMIAEHFARGPKYCRYNAAMREDLVSAAMLKCVKNIKNYKHEYRDKCFNYFTRCVEHAFWEILDRHYKHVNLIAELTE